MNSLSSKEACEIAATRLGLSDTSAFSSTLSYIPYGCIYQSNAWLMWNVPLKLNDVSVACGSKIGSNEYDCLCQTSGRTSIFDDRLAQ